MNPPSMTASRIKPLLAHKIHIQNSYKYRDFHVKRYKGTLHYKFTYLKELGSPLKKTQKHLCRVLKRIKFAKSIDFLDLNSSKEWNNKHLQLFIFKRISRSEDVLFRTFRYYQDLFDGFTEKGLRYFTQIRRLFYIFEIGWAYKVTPPKRNQVKNPLKTLKFCPAIHSVTIKIPPLSFALLPPNCFRDFSRYPCHLKHLAIQENFPLSSPITSITSLKNLKSIQLPFGRPYHPEHIVNTLNQLSNLAHLHKIDLKFEGHLVPEVYPAFLKIAEKGTLKKLSLNFGFPLKEFSKLLTPLSGCQLTHFSLTSQAPRNASLQAIAKFIEKNQHLEYLKLHISDISLSGKNSCFKEVCQEIDKLQALRHLTLMFKAGIYIKPQNLGSELQEIFKKTIPIQTFALESDQMEAPAVVFSLIEALKPSSSALQKLKIDLGAYSPDKNSQVVITEFMQSLVNIRVLKLLCFDLSAKTFLNNIVHAVCGLKYLRVLELSSFVKGTITKNQVLEALGTILKKSGLRKLKYKYDKEFKEKVIDKESKKVARINLKQLLRDNPSLEDTPLDYSTFERCHYESELNW